MITTEGAEMIDAEYSMRGWHLDRRVPISLIVTILIQTMLFVWFFRGLVGDVEGVTIRADKIEQELAVRREIIDMNKTNVAIINQNLVGIQRSLDRIEKEVSDKK